MGATGRGLAEVRWVDTADIDIMMGTFTRVLVEWVGYIAASHGPFRFCAADAPVARTTTRFPDPVGNGSRSWARI
jgi:7-keto-8-aminopelargonate synthetase-like enzyme